MNYTELKVAIKNWIHDDSAEVTALIDTFIIMGEARLNRDLKTPKLLTTLTGTFGSVIAYPDDFVSTVSLLIVSGTDYTPLNPISYSELRRGHIGFCEAADGIIVTSTITGSYELAYKCALPAIATNTTNFISVAHPDLYLYACLIESAAFIRDELQGDFAARYVGLLNDVNISDGRLGQMPRMRSDTNVP